MAHKLNQFKTKAWIRGL